MPTHVAWSSIELLHNVVRTLNFLRERDGQALPTVQYRGKVKLHGTNTAVQVTRDGVFYQSRTEMLTPQADYKGFSQWASRYVPYWTSLPECIVFGEWAGPGIEPGMAVSKVPTKVFAVFALQFGLGGDARIVYDPADIAKVLGPTLPPGMYVLPWYGSPLTLEFGDATQMATSVSLINDLVAEIEQEDPWVKTTFGLSGLGEGVVFYPVGEGVPTDPEGLAQLMFKAKGEKHRTTRTKDAAQVVPEVASGVEDFVNLVLTEARLQQGVQTACGGKAEMRGMGGFLQWIAADVQKETVAELAAAGLTWGQVKGAVQTRARAWFKTQAGR